MSCCGNCDNDRVSGTCGNPCAVSSVNTATCENIASQIENFSVHFFGEVTKTEAGGVVTWTLPCNLDIGLENNPRMDDEGLACYFLRLFEDGIMGATGPQGPQGADGTNGRNAFTVTLAGFTQPSLAAPNIQVLTSYNPVFVPGLYVFISTSGWYLITAADTIGNLWLMILQGVAGAPGTIPAGKLVIPSGTPGHSIAGPQGPTGPIGPQGTPGVSYTTNNEFYPADGIGTDYSVQLVGSQVTFVTTHPEVTLSAAGRYLVSANVSVYARNPVVFNDTLYCYLQDVTASTTVPASARNMRGFANGSWFQVVINVIYDVPVGGTTLALFASATSANVFAIFSPQTVITAVRLE